ncbi:hypothetical protein, partial [Gemmiger formicilis]
CGRCRGRIWNPPLRFVLALRPKRHIFIIFYLLFFLALFCASEKGRGGSAAALLRVSLQIMPSG